MPDYASNSNKDKATPEPTKKVEKIIKGEVIVKQQSLGSRFKNVFLGGDLNTAGQYVVAEVVLPAVRNLLVEVVTKGMDSIIYGERGIRRPGRPVNYGGRTQYNNPINRVPYSPPQTAIERWSGGGKKAVEDIVLASRAEADAVVDTMLAVVEQYDVVSVADMYDMVGLPSVHTDNKWGWTNLAAISVNQIRNGWQVSFPPLEEIQ